jgi:hypothetical protein
VVAVSLDGLGLRRSHEGTRGERVPRQAGGAPRRARETDGAAHGRVRDPDPLGDRGARRVPGPGRDGGGGGATTQIEAAAPGALRRDLEAVGRPPVRRLRPRHPGLRHVRCRRARPLPSLLGALRDGRPPTVLPVCGKARAEPVGIDRRGRGDPGSGEVGSRARPSRRRGIPSEPSRRGGERRRTGTRPGAFVEVSGSRRIGRRHASGAVRRLGAGGATVYYPGERGAYPFS